MKQIFTQSFKIQAVEKALTRKKGITLSQVANELNIGDSTLNKWITKAKRHEFDDVSSDEINRMTRDKRPQDWSLEERLEIIGKCASLDDATLNEYCREMGVYPHHIQQWKLDFINGSSSNDKPVSRSELKTLRYENKTLKKEINRKDRALAETAALLVLQKKVNAIWGFDEDS